MKLSVGTAYVKDWTNKSFRFTGKVYPGDEV